MVKAAVERKEAAWKDVMGARVEVTKDRLWRSVKKKRKRLRKCIYQGKKEVNEQFRRKMNQDEDRTRKFFWKKVSTVNGEKVEGCIRIKDVNERLALGLEEDKM